jgi:hypothetical protein
MYFTPEEVKVGLSKGRSFKRYFGTDSRPGCEYARALGNDRFEHTVVGAGYGGLAELDISIIDKTRGWCDSNWQLLED